jgi:hypothetical protein
MSQIIKTSAALNGYKFTEAASGTIYLTKEDQKIRIGDHEPNDSLSFMRGGKPTLEIYTKGAGGETLLNNAAEICEKLAELLPDFKLSPSAKAAITRNDKERAAAAAIAVAAVKQASEVAGEVASFQAKVNAVVANNKEQVLVMLAEAEAYSQKGSNGDKRRKLRRSHFSNAFKAVFGFEASPGDIKI